MTISISGISIPLASKLVVITTCTSYFLNLAIISSLSSGYIPPIIIVGFSPFPLRILKSTSANDFEFTKITEEVIAQVANMSAKKSGLPLGGHL